MEPTQATAPNLFIAGPRVKRWMLVSACASRNTASVNQGPLKKKIHIDQQLHHRYLISLEGNDKASGLQWMLASNSVVLMPPPTVESWLLESRLEPWVHFIPIKADGTDLEERLIWAKSHSAACRRIAAASTDYVLGHPYYSDPARNAELEREVAAWFLAHASS